MGAAKAAEKRSRVTRMADVYSKETRSRVMRAVKGRNTRPELRLRKALWAAGVRGWRLHRRDLPGTPDIAFGGKRRLAVFVDGAWFHGHPSRWQPGRCGEYWDNKIRRNMQRDADADEALEAMGWRVLRFWDFDIEKAPEKVVERIIEALKEEPRS